MHSYVCLLYTSGSEKQSEELVNYLLSNFEDDPAKIWESNIFGRSLHELVNEGLQTKLAKMPVDAPVSYTHLDVYKRQILGSYVTYGCSQSPKTPSLLNPSVWTSL